MKDSSVVERRHISIKFSGEVTILLPWPLDIEWRWSVAEYGLASQPQGASSRALGSCRKRWWYLVLGHWLGVGRSQVLCDRLRPDDDGKDFISSCVRKELARD